jgi:sec-independent protein translocase protein TatC
LISSGFMQRTRPYAVFLILCLAAVLAPTPDPMTFLALGIPMCLLYEICIWLAWLVEWRRKKSGAITVVSDETIE